MAMMTMMMLLSLGALVCGAHGHGAGSVPLMAWTTNKDMDMSIPSSMYVVGPRTIDTVTKSLLASSHVSGGCATSNLVVVDWTTINSKDLLRYSKAFTNLQSMYDASSHHTHVDHLVTVDESMTGDAVDASNPVMMIRASIERVCGAPAHVIMAGQDEPANYDSASILITVVQLARLSQSSLLDRFDAIQLDDQHLSTVLREKMGNDAKPLTVFITSSVMDAGNHNANGLLTNQHRLTRRDQPVTFNLTVPYSKRSIFQKYAFFNDALYMGITSMVFVVTILVVAVSMVGGMQSPTKFETPQKTK